jgi:hypothetical protein
MVVAPKRALTVNDPITAEPCVGYQLFDPSLSYLT